ncbi:genetic suppressor element 1-like protein, partial [Dinothrombium tinctorium]
MLCPDIDLSLSGIDLNSTKICLPQLMSLYAREKAQHKVTDVFSTVPGLGGNHQHPHKLAPPTPSSLLTSTAVSKSSGIQRITAVSPLYQGVSVPAAATGQTPPVGHISASSMPPASRTSSFAAALRKLAKQAGDPVDNHNGAIHGSSMVKSHIYPSTSPIVNSSTPVMHLNSAHESELAGRKFDVHSSGNMYDRHHMSRAENLSQRTSPLVQMRPLPSSRPPNEALNLSPLGVGPNNQTANNHNNHSKAGFQPYRNTLSGSCLDDALRSSGSTPISTSSSMPTHLLPYADALIASSYPYHPFVPPIPPPGLTSHLTHPSFRIDDQMYLERFGLLRPQATAGVSVTQSGASIHPSSVPSYQLGSRYSELLATHQERVMFEERQRLLGHSSLVSGQSNIGSVSTTNTYKVPIQSTTASDIEKRIQSLSSGLQRRESSSSNCGSIIQGTPRDVQSLVSKKSNGSSSLKPLNLTSNNMSTPVMIDLTNHSNINTTTSHLWRPQTIDCDDNSRSRQQLSLSQQMPKYQNEEDSHIRKRTQSYSSIDPINFQSAKKPRTHSINSNHYMDKREDELFKKCDVMPNGNCCNNLPSSFTTYRSSDLQLTPPFNHLSFSSEPKQSIVVSKLDLKEKKLREKRVNGIENGEFSSDDSDYLSEEESDNENKNEQSIKTVITKGPPLKLDANPEKENFLRSFGLTTHEKRREIEFEKLVVKRRRISSTLDFCLKQCTTSSEINASDEFIFDLNPSSILPNTLNTSEQESNLESKVNFMEWIGLKLQDNIDAIRENELIWEGVVRERDRRKAERLCFSITCNNLTKETISKWFVALQHQKAQNIKLNGSLSHFTSSSSHHQKQKAALTLLQNNHILMRSQRNNKEKKDFAQRFHQSVFNETSIRKKNRFEEEEHYASNRMCFKWPGVEAVMESYVRYAEEQMQERDFLQERLSKWKSRLQEANSEAELLSQRINNLLQAKKKLDEERETYQ